METTTSIRDLADLIEQPMHRLGLHGPAWVVVAVSLGLLVIWATAFSIRRTRR